MIYCLSCEKYPKDVRVIPYGSTFPVDRFTVKLLTTETPQELILDGSDVEELPDNIKFACGSMLYVANESDGCEQYIYVDDENGFVKWDIPTGQ